MIKSNFTKFAVFSEAIFSINVHINDKICQLWAMETLHSIFSHLQQNRITKIIENSKIPLTECLFLKLYGNSSLIFTILTIW